MNNAVKQLSTDIKNLKKDTSIPSYIKVFVSSNIMKWYGMICFDDTFPYEDEYERASKGGEYIFEISFCKNYPSKAPVILFLTPNPCFTSGSSICLAGLTHYHQESVNIGSRVGNIITGISSTFNSILRKKYKDGNGIAITLNTNIKNYPKFAEESRKRNLKLNDSVVSLFYDKDGKLLNRRSLDEKTLTSEIVKEMEKLEIEEADINELNEAAAKRKQEQANSLKNSVINTLNIDF